MIKLQFFDGKHWITVSEWVSEHLAWISLGGDDINYRTIDEDGNVLTVKTDASVCDRCKSIAKVREVMPDTYLCTQCEALLDQEMPIDGVDFTPARPIQGDLPF